MEKIKIPVTIITGGLGAGKTSLINRILTENKKTRFAIIENEFGEIGIDQDLIETDAEPEVVEISDGCICCTVRSDLVKALTAIYEKKDDFDSLLIETTGLAEPGPVAQVMIADPQLAGKFTLNAVVSLVDAEYIMMHLDKNPVAAEQIGFADILILNKSDRVDTEKLENITARLTDMNVQADLTVTEHANIDTRKILSADSFSLDRVLALDPQFIEMTGTDQPEDNLMGLMNRMPTYQDEISSIGLVMKGALDEKKVDAWLTFLTAIQGDDILRMKGILNIKGLDERLVIQGVHSTLTGDTSKPWADAERESRLLFIGRFLDRKQLEDGLKKCLA